MAAVIVATMSPKGGCGKTPIAIGLADHLHQQGQKVALLDADPQNAVINWHEMRSQLPFEATFADVQPFPIKLKLGADAYINHNYADYDYVVIDTQGDLKPVHQNIMMAAHLIISPVFASKSSFDGVVATAELAADAAEVRGDWPVLVACRTRWQKGGKNERGIQKKLDKLFEDGLVTVMDRATSSLDAPYKYSINEGVTIREGATLLPKSERAAFENAHFQESMQMKEIISLLKEISEAINEQA